MPKFTIKQIISSLKDNFIEQNNFSEKELSQEIELITTDSRQATSEKCCFIALKGKRADDELMNAHNFVKSATDKDSFAIVSEDCPNLPQNKLIKVKDTFTAFGQMGNLHRQQFKGKLIGITGSSGKTSTKDLLKEILSDFGKTYATPKNLNSQLGVPQCLIDMTKESYDYAIIEMGMSDIGEMRKLTSYAQPDIAIAINVFPMHLEYFENIEAIAKEKASIFEGLQENGIAIYNADSQCSNILQKEAEKHHNASYGKVGKDIQLLSENGTTISVKTKSTDLSYAIPENNIAFKYNSLSTLCICQALNLPLEKIISKYKNTICSEGRGQIKTFTLPNNKNIEIIDESYGGGHAEAMIIGLSRLQNRQTKGRKIAIIGNMAELGSETETEHKKVGNHLNTMQLDKVIFIGEPTKIIIEELNENLKSISKYHEKIDEVLPTIENSFENNDLIFIKGAHYSSQVWKIVDKLEKV